MKVGDRFTDGSRLYEVLEVCGDGIYVSKCIGEVKDFDIKPQKEESKEVKTYTKTEINRMAYDNLKELCAELEIEVSTGTQMKKDIIEKLGL